MKRALPTIILYVSMAMVVGFLALALKYDDSHRGAQRPSTLSRWGADEESLGRMAWICGEAHVADKKGIIYDGLDCAGLYRAIGLEGK